MTQNKTNPPTRKKDIIKVLKSSGKFGDGFSIFINGRCVIDASCFTEDFMICIDNNKMKKFKQTKGKYGKTIYKWDKRYKT